MTIDHSASAALRRRSTLTRERETLTDQIVRITETKPAGWQAMLRGLNAAALRVEREIATIDGIPAAA